MQTTFTLNPRPWILSAAALIVAIGGIAIANPAEAGDYRHGHGHGHGHYKKYHHGYHGYRHHRPYAHRYVAPRPVYYAPRPVYYAPAPAYGAISHYSGPVYYPAPRYYRTPSSSISFTYSR